MSLKGSKTEENLKAAFAGESQANRRYLSSHRKPTLKDTMTYRPYSAQQQRVKPGMLMVIWNI